MKRVLFIMTALMVVFTASAQQNATWKRLESNFQLGGGLFLESGYLAREENPGAVLRLSYGLDIRLRNNRFTDSNGVERTITEILASQVSVIGGTLQ